MERAGCWPSCLVRCFQGILASLGYGAWGVYMEQESIETTKIEGITSILNMKLHERGGVGGWVLSMDLYKLAR